LELPSFWLQQPCCNHQAVTRKLVERVHRLTEDLDVERGTAPKTSCTDVQGIDNIASAVLNGLRIWDCQMPFRFSGPLRNEFRRLVELLSQ